MSSCFGLDVGSTTAKLVEYNKGIVRYSIVPTNNWRELINGCNGEIYSTGYFRHSVPNKKAITEITSAIFGVKEFCDAELIVDIGGQDTKIIDLRNKTFKLNNKCSAGTGAFIEQIARYFSLSVEELSKLHFKAKRIAKINSTCSVFAHSEMLSALVAGYKVEEVIAGMHYAFAKKLKEQIPEADKIVLIGGCAKNFGLVSALSKILGKKVIVPKEPQIVNAVGAVRYCKGL
ncbi:MAG: acyl-CoA dehydratase activase [Candidatus Thermoplasmatota archaeon]